MIQFLQRGNKSIAGTYWFPDTRHAKESNIFELLSRAKNTPTAKTWISMFDWLLFIFLFSLALKCLSPSNSRQSHNMSPREKDLLSIFPTATTNCGGLLVQSKLNYEIRSCYMHNCGTVSKTVYRSWNKTGLKCYCRQFLPSTSHSF